MRKTPIASFLLLFLATLFFSLIISGCDWEKQIVFKNRSTGDVFDRTVEFVNSKKWKFKSINKAEGAMSAIISETSNALVTNGVYLDFQCSQTGDDVTVNLKERRSGGLTITFWDPETTLKEYMAFMGEGNGSGTSSFDYDSYRPVEFSYFTDGFKDYEKNEGPGVGLYMEKLRFEIASNDSLAQITKESRDALSFWGQVYGAGKEYLDLFTKQMVFSKGGYEFTFLFQDKLSRHYIEEISAGDKVTLYALFGSYDTYGNKFTVMINEFRKVEQ